MIIWRNFVEGYEFPEDILINQSINIKQIVIIEYNDLLNI
jgi:hypothetical protein